MGRIVPYMKWKIKNVGNHQPEHLFKLKYTWCAWHVQTDLFIEAFLLSLWWLVISSLHLRGAPFLVSRKPRCLRPWKNQTAAVTLLTKYWHSFSNSCAVIFLPWMLPMKLHLPIRMVAMRRQPIHWHLKQSGGSCKRFGKWETNFRKPQ